jgi:hypothetical protein
MAAASAALYMVTVFCYSHLDTWSISRNTQMKGP